MMFGSHGFIHERYTGLPLKETRYSVMSVIVVVRGRGRLRADAPQNILLESVVKSDKIVLIIITDK